MAGEVFTVKNNLPRSRSFSHDQQIGQLISNPDSLLVNKNTETILLHSVPLALNIGGTEPCTDSTKIWPVGGARATLEASLTCWHMLCSQTYCFILLYKFEYVSSVYNLKN